MEPFELARCGDCAWLERKSHWKKLEVDESTLLKLPQFGLAEEETKSGHRIERMRAVAFEGRAP